MTNHSQDLTDETQSYRGDDDGRSVLSQGASSVLERMQTRLSFFNPRMKPVRQKIIMKFALIYLLMAVMMLGIFSIYWGSMMHKNDHQKYLKMLVVIEDTETIDGVPPIIGQQVINVVTSAKAKTLGDWHIYTPQNFSDIQPKDSHGDTQADIEELIHKQHFWGGIHVKKDASSRLYQALVDGNTSYVSGNETWSFVYESGRDFTNVPTYIVNNGLAIQKMVLADQDGINGQFIDVVRKQGKDSSKVLDNGWQVISQPLTFESKDMRPVTQPTVLAPAQVGLIYLIIVTFFQFNFFVDFHKIIAGYPMKRPHFLLYRLLSSFVSYFWLSLVYSLVSLAFQIDFTRAFGRGGFPIYWMTMWLTMTAVGGMNELMAHTFIMVFPPLLGFWLIFWVICNVSPTYTPMALTANFYRFGYAMPIYNANELIKMIFFDTYRGHMGRCYGILVAWVVLTNVGLMIVLPLFGKVMGKRAVKMRQEAEEEAARQKAV